MTVRLLDALPALYERDETAWLDAMAELAREGRVEGLDLPHLAEFLSDMARRDRREVESRLIVLLAHLLKWEHQADRRSRSWRATVIEQGQELEMDAGRGVLRNHAEEILGRGLPEGRETGRRRDGLARRSIPGGMPVHRQPTARRRATRGQRLRRSISDLFRIDRS